ncbi:MAG: hypothetical protein ABMA64_03430 [Myxococcota bacterium]
MWIGLWLAGCVVGGGESSWTFQGATSMTASLANGDLRVWSSGGPETLVTYDGGGVGRAALPDVWQDSDGSVHADGGGQLGGGDLDVWVSDGIPVAGFLDRGDLSVELTAPADIEACVGAGSVSIGVPAGAYALEIDAGVGSVDLEIVDDPSAAHTIHVCVGAGDIDVHVYDPMLTASE